MPAPATLAFLARRRTIVRALVAAVTAAILAGAFALCAAVAVLGANAMSTGSICSSAGLSGQRGADAGGVLSFGNSNQAPANLTARQLDLAKGYVSVGKQLGVPRSGQIIAIMMALQESSLRMLANVNVPGSLSFPHDGVGNDHDSLGTAQQRPTAGWGSVEELMNPIYNVRAFYGGPAGPNQGSPRGLLDIPGWQTMSKGQAAQAVQVSAFPELYARWEPEALAIVDVLDGGMAPAPCVDPAPVSAPTTAPADLSQIRKDILRFTQAGVGGSYVWGGTAFKAWDCSGFVQWIFRQAGINLPRVEQWRVGKRTDNPQPGDLVVQNAQGPDNWGHVGIYAGDGMMYSALNPSVGTRLHPIAWNSDTAYFDLLA
ncbi:hypothetical protein JOE40_000667 [Arthrobacter sp. PvP102]|uniref:C40 family peptidase n=1 Tax=unclassified Arthrobacter TaxID=235627 RepID=UPI001AE6AC12|nr:MULTISPECIES: C40 family peptidase [unclassified Arthrobacter]MBP1235199.1 hypothetical protein [Arthrobacter sp. PvP103]MBP1236158.1 hypothetical protein [Arthrobacter sp. PvP102]